MNGYVKCPHCDLNYIRAGEKCCAVCHPKMRGKTIADAEVRNEKYKQVQRELSKKQNESMGLFYAYRFNRKANY